MLKVWGVISGSGWDFRDALHIFIFNKSGITTGLICFVAAHSR